MGDRRLESSRRVPEKRAGLTAREQGLQDMERNLQLKRENIARAFSNLQETLKKNEVYEDFWHIMNPALQSNQLDIPFNNMNYEQLKRFDHLTNSVFKQAYENARTRFKLNTINTELTSYWRAYSDERDNVRPDSELNFKNNIHAIIQILHNYVLRRENVQYQIYTEKQAIDALHNFEGLLREKFKILPSNQQELHTYKRMRQDIGLLDRMNNQWKTFLK